MYARAVLIGRIAKLEYVKEDIITYLSVILAVKRPFKNLDGKYETDFFKIKTLGEISTKVESSMKIGDLVGINARLTTEKITLDEEKFYYENKLFAENITKLANKLC